MKVNELNNISILIGILLKSNQKPSPPSKYGLLSWEEKYVIGETETNVDIFSFFFQDLTQVT